MRAVNSFGQIPCSHSNRALSHFVEIGEVLNIETWHKGRLLLLESIVSEVKCERASVAAKVVRKLMGLMQLYSETCIKRTPLGNSVVSA